MHRNLQKMIKLIHYLDTKFDDFFFYALHCLRLGIIVLYLRANWRRNVVVNSSEDYYSEAISIW